MATFNLQPKSSPSSVNNQSGSSSLHAKQQQQRPFASHYPSDSSSSEGSFSSLPILQPLHVSSSRVQQPVRNPHVAATTSLPADNQDVRSIRTTHSSAQARELEIDASSILLPVISHTQQDALYEYAAHSRPDDEPDPSPNEDYSSSSSDDDVRAETIAGKAPLRTPDRAENYSPMPSVEVQPPQQSVPASSLKGKLHHHHHHHHHGHGYKNVNGNFKEKKSSSGSVFSLPSIQFPNLQLPKNVSFPSLPSFAASSGERFGAMVDKRRKRAKTVLTTERDSTEGPIGRGHRKSLSTSEQSQREPGYIKPLPTPAPILETFSKLPPQRPPHLRRSSSMGSIPSRMELTRTVSTTSSIGNDDLFAHIHTRPNVRAKAIKENLRAALPNVSMPQLSQLSNFRPFGEKTETPLLNDIPESSHNSPVPQVANGSAKVKGESYPTIDTVMGDVVVLGGYRGSELREITPVNRKVWVPIKVGLNLRKVDFEVGLEPEDEERVTERIIPDGMLTHIGPVDISRRLLKRLRSNQLVYSRRTHDWGYDWRLSPHINSASLIRFLESLPCNQPDSLNKGAIVIAHSLGGIITRHAVNKRPDLFSGVIYAGAPQHTVNILGPFRNGDSVLFNSKIFSAQVTFTLRSSFVFLPEDGECFVDKETGEKIPVNFYDVKIWRELGLSPCVSDFPVNAPKEGDSTPRNMTLLQKLQNHASNISVGTSMISINSNSSSNTNVPSPSSPSPSSDATKNVESEISRDRTIAPQMNSSGNENSSSPSITIPKSAALKYLQRTLASTLEFKRELAPQEDHIRYHRYPPTAVLYAKETPTVKGARVFGREGIKRDDCYEDLVFGAGDGVVLARASMLPDGYPRPVKKVCVQRGHLGLLGDLMGVEECLKGVVEGRGW